MQINFDYLDKFLSDIRLRFKSQYIQSNPFFYLVKPTDENLKRYNVRHPDSTLFLLIDYLLFLPQALTLIFQSLGHSILKFKESIFFEKQSLPSSHNLVVSHFTHSQKYSDSDVIFGFNSQKANTAIFYLNHTRLPLKNVYGEYKRFGRDNIVLNSKSLTPIAIALIQLQQIRPSLTILMYAINLNKKVDIVLKRILIKAAISQYSRAHIANLVLMRRLEYVIKRVQPKNIIITLEGHAFENSIIKLRDSSFPDMRVFGLQHAPLVPSQRDFYRNIALLENNDLVMTTGKRIQKRILEENPRVKVEIVGSPKTRILTPSLRSLKHIKVLGAPEGTIQALKSFADLFGELSLKLPEFDFKLRVHPSLSEREIHQSLSPLVRANLFEISQSTLEEDLTNSHFTVFRSSAVGIEGLNFGSIPLHFDSGGSGALNPLYDTQFGHLTFTSITTLVAFFSKTDYKDYLSQEYQTKAYRLYSEYFEPLKDFHSITS